MFWVILLLILVWAAVIRMTISAFLYFESLADGKHYIMMLLVFIVTLIIIASTVAATIYAFV